MFSSSVDHNVAYVEMTLRKEIEAHTDKQWAEMPESKLWVYYDKTTEMPRHRARIDREFQRRLGRPPLFWTKVSIVVAVIGVAAGWAGILVGRLFPTDQVTRLQSQVSGFGEQLKEFEHRLNQYSSSVVTEPSAGPPPAATPLPSTPAPTLLPNSTIATPTPTGTQTPKQP